MNKPTHSWYGYHWDRYLYHSNNPSDIRIMCTTHIHYNYALIGLPDQVHCCYWMTRPGLLHLLLCITAIIPVWVSQQWHLYHTACVLCMQYEYHSNKTINICIIEHEYYSKSPSIIGRGTSGRMGFRTATEWLCNGSRIAEKGCRMAVE